MMRSRSATAGVSAAIALTALGASFALTSPGATGATRLQASSSQPSPKAGHQPDPWPEWNYNGAATSYNPGEHIITPTRVGKLVEKWKIPAYDGNRAATPPVAVRAGTLYEANPKRLLAYSMSSGRLLHTYVISRGSNAIVGPAIAGSRLITTIGPDLAAINLSTGTLAWKVSEPQTSTLRNEWTSLTFSGSTVFAILQTETFTPVLDDTYQLEAVSAASGKQLWSAADTRGPIAVGGGKVYAPASGVVIEASPLDADEADINAYNETTGALSWTFSMPGNPFTSSLAYTDSTVLVTAGSTTTAASDIYALAAGAGTIRWTHTEPLPTNGLPNGAFIVTDGKRVVYYNGNPSKLIALSVANGDVLWRRAANDFFDHVIGAGGVLYGQTDNDHLRAFRMTSGKTLWTAHTTGLGPVLVADGRLISDDKTHYLAYGER